MRFPLREEYLILKQTERILGFVCLFFFCLQRYEADVVALLERSELNVCQHIVAFTS